MNEQTQQQVRVRIEHARSEHQEATTKLYDLFERLGITKAFLGDYWSQWEEILIHLAHTEGDIRNALNKWDKGIQEEQQ